MTPLLLKEFTASSCLGLGASATLNALVAQRSGLKRCEFESVNIDTYVGVANNGFETLPQHLAGVERHDYDRRVVLLPVQLG